MISLRRLNVTETEWDYIQYWLSIVYFTIYITLALGLSAHGMMANWWPLLYSVSVYCVARLRKNVKGIKACIFSFSEKSRTPTFLCFNPCTVRICVGSTSLGCGPVDTAVPLPVGIVHVPQLVRTSAPCVSMQNLRKQLSLVHAYGR